MSKNMKSVRTSELQIIVNPTNSISYVHAHVPSMIMFTLHMHN